MQTKASCTLHLEKNQATLDTVICTSIDAESIGSTYVVARTLFHTQRCHTKPPDLTILYIQKKKLFPTLYELREQWHFTSIATVLEFSVQGDELISNLS